MTEHRGIIKPPNFIAAYLPSYKYCAGSLEALTPPVLLHMEWSWLPIQLNQPQPLYNFHMVTFFLEASNVLSKGLSFWNVVCLEAAIHFWPHDLKLCFGTAYHLPWAIMWLISLCNIEWWSIVNFRQSAWLCDTVQYNIHSFLKLILTQSTWFTRWNHNTGETGQIRLEIWLM